MIPLMRPMSDEVLQRLTIRLSDIGQRTAPIVQETEMFCYIPADTAICCSGVQGLGMA